MTVTLDTVQTDLAYLLGEQSVPATTNADYAVRQAFIQRSLERIYRAYDFELGMVGATVSLTSGAGLLPSDTRTAGPDLDVRVTAPGTNDDYIFEHIEYRDQDSYGQNSFKYWTTIDTTTGRWQLNTTEPQVSALYVRYTPNTPVISATVATPFPSSMVIALGALVFYRQSEDSEADISVEEIQFQNQLDEVVRAERRNRPKRAARTRQELLGHYTGELTDAD